VTSIVLGLVAALCWGVHDLCVRKISATEGIFAALFAVLFFGSLFGLPFALLWGDAAAVMPYSWLQAIGAGLFFAGAGLGLFKALEIGPVRLVAPIIGGYPILSLLWATYLGSALTLGHWLAVFAVVAGVAFIAVNSDDGASSGRKRAAIWWSLMSGSGYAASFALSQGATQLSDEWSILLPLRLTALAAIFFLAMAFGERIRPRARSVGILAVMGALDILALTAVSAAGNQAFPEFASVGASTFGLVTVVLASIFLREALKPLQWGAVLLVFVAVGSLGL